jgi:hypothetical protein
MGEVRELMSRMSLTAAAYSTLSGAPALRGDSKQHISKLTVFLPQTPRQRRWLISTDKAVKPVGIIGMTKRIAECLLLSLGKDSTTFTAVRLGTCQSNGRSFLVEW